MLLELQQEQEEQVQQIQFQEHQLLTQVVVEVELVVEQLEEPVQVEEE